MPEIKTGDAFAGMMQDFNGELSGRVKKITMPWPKLNSAIGTGLGCTHSSLLAGPPGNGKTFFALQILNAAIAQDKRCLYIPLEMTDSELLRRCYAFILGSWKIIDSDIKHSTFAMEKAIKDKTLRDILRQTGEAIAENPTMPVIDGRTITLKRLTSQNMLDFLATKADKYDLIIVDPVSKLDFDGAQQWRAQEDFVKYIDGICRLHKCHVMLVCHTAKRQRYQGKQTPISMDDIQGSAAFTRYVDSIMLLDYHHDGASSTVLRVGQNNMPVEHKRTLKLDKARHGKGAGLSFAFDFSETSPEFKEHGIIVKE